jgi:hypothetical protein
MRHLVIWGRGNVLAAGRVIPVFLVVGLLLLCGCKSRVEQDEPHHVGAKINIPDFIQHTAAYRGKAIMLPLKVEEPIAQGQSLRNYLGRDVLFATLGPKGERLDLVIRIPETLSVPEVGAADEVFVTFVCTQGSLRRGNEARTIQAP